MTRFKAGLRYAVLVSACALLVPGPSGAQQRFVNGLFVSTPQGAVELITYGESMHNGQLRLQEGSLEDVPTVKPWTRLRILSSIPLWQPVAVFCRQRRHLQETGAGNATTDDRGEEVERLRHRGACLGSRSDRQRGAAVSQRSRV